MNGDPTAVGFVPAAPLLVPQVAAGSAGADEDLRNYCRDVARYLVDHAKDGIAVVAPDTRSGSWTESATWGFEGFGVNRRPPDDRERLPWQLGVGAWLLDDVGWDGARRYLSVEVVSGGFADGETVLVVGDGSARRTEKAPGHLDERAEAFDGAIADSIARGDISALGSLDAGVAAELMCAGAPAWRAVAEQLAGRRVAQAELLVHSAPYGVGYFAGWWQLQSR